MRDALKLGSLAPVDWESGAGDLDPGFEVDELVLVGKLPVGLGRSSEIGPGSFFGHDFVVVFALSGGHAVVRAVGEFEQGGFLLVDEVLLLLVEGVDALLERPHFGPSGFRLLLFAGLEEVADRPAGRVLLGLQVVHLLLGGAALQVEFEDLVQQGCGVEATLGKGRLNGGTIVTEGLEGQHGL